uniref:Poly(A) RNA polymerase protein cid1 n=1 Tax=Anthurium amnicola TaxID=1678845 RepID=A0A1D1Z8R1_9ARAE
MGDVHVCPPTANGVLAGEGPSASSPSQSSNPHPSKISADSWRVAERATQGIIRRIQPTVVADQRRREVVEHVRNLIKGVADAEIFPFGSVPLKTYLPDGDIDLTAIETPRSEDTLAKDVLAVLQAEEQNRNSEFEVKDVQYIHAEVKLVKCLVQSIVVDISFQQVGGLCTLCFLEEVDRRIGKNHLFKCSIILIKAWCYYESRILGAHHGLISTYALETLVLYIFHVFHSSLDGPLAVLYRFLDYFSKFDWDNYCVSLNGPVCLSSLPEIIAETPESDGGDLLFSRDFLKSCEDQFTSAFKLSDNNSNSRLFHQKHLNIVDPLKANNNLGRSVSKGNFYRIRSAFTYGARKLGRILILPGERITGELNRFFTNTLDRHDSGERPDVQDATLSDSVSSVSSESIPIFLKLGEKAIDGAGSTSPIDFHGGLFENINNLRISGLVSEPFARPELGKGPSCNQLAGNYLHRYTKAQSNGFTEGNAISGICQTGDAKDMCGGLDPRNTKDTCKPCPTTSEVGSSVSGKVHHAPHLFFCKENGNVVSSELEPEKTTPDLPSRKMSSASSEDILDAEVNGKEMATSSCSPESSGFSDLSGDHDTHKKSLLYAMGCLGRQPSAVFSNTQQQDSLHQLNMFPHTNANGMIPGPFSPARYFPLNATFIPSAYGLEDMPRTRGTGTYFPNANHWLHMDRRSPGRGRNQALVTQMMRPRNTGRVVTPAERTLGDRGHDESPSHSQLPCSNGNTRWKPGQLESCQASCSTSRGFSHPNVLNPPLENGLEFGSFGPVKVATTPPEPPRNLDCHVSDNQISGTHEPPSTIQKLGVSTPDERSRQSYHLKNDDDFPPLRGLVQWHR